MVEGHRQQLGLLEGVRIAAFTQFLLGPVAVQYLADMGADVIKVEAPNGAWERGWSGAETFLNGESCFFLLSHRNVRDLVVDLKHPEGRAVVDRLIAKSDIVVQNFRPGVAERLGLGYEELCGLKPDVIYASASGYGSHEMVRGLPGQDLLVQALSGLAAVTGSRGGPPVPTGSAVVDSHGASLLAMGILGALYHRERTGVGQCLEVNMLEAALDLQLEPVTYWLNGADIERPEEGVGSSFHSAPYGVYAVKDGYVAISMSSLGSVGHALGSPPQLDRYLAGNQAWEKRDEVYRALANLLSDRSTESVLAEFRAAGVWVAPVRGYRELFADAAVAELNLVLEVNHPRAGLVKLLRHPVRYGSGESSIWHLPPALDEDTDQVLRELGYGVDAISRLRTAGAVGRVQ